MAMQEFLRPAIGVAVFVLMLVVGLDCTAEGFRRGAARPFLIATVTLVQFVCIPALILLVVALLGVPPAVAAALLLVGASPSGSISNAYTFLARGSTALSVTLTAASSLVAFGATPLALSVAGHLGGAEIADSLTFPPGPLLRQLLISMMLPLATGFALRKRFPDLGERFLQTARGICVVVILAVVSLTVATNPAEVWKQVQALATPVLVITPCLFAIAWLVGRAFRLGSSDMRAVLFELPCRNVALAMLIALSVLQRPDLAYIAMAFFLLEAVLLLLLAGILPGIRRPEGRE
jgi:BASS family bile acid:Na+ symporter